jgi:GGDEF domain-containing protein
MNAAEMLERKRRKLELKREAREQAKILATRSSFTDRRSRRAVERELAKMIEEEQANG